MIIFRKTILKYTMGAIIIASYFLIPAFLLFYSTRMSIINKIGIVVFCYGIGLVMGNIRIIPEAISGVQGDLMGVTILLGIPLVLFSENVVKWAKMAKTTFISLLLGVASVVVLVFVGKSLGTKSSWSIKIIDESRQFLLCSSSLVIPRGRAMS